jgi:two-component system, OmpR family, sensor histidine kinase KdpD
LQERLRDGKIYASAKIEQSLNNFFQRRNLVALRELALREVANNIEDSEQFNGEMTSQTFCNVHERVLVCVSTYPNSLQLLRRGARIAGYMHAQFYVLFVVDPDRFLTKEESLHVETCERLCKEFSGEFLRVQDCNVIKAIAHTAQKYRITQIVIGESQKSRWQILWHGSLVQKILRLLRSVDIHIISTGKS